MLMIKFLYETILQSLDLTDQECVKKKKGVGGVHQFRNTSLISLKYMQMSLKDNKHDLHRYVINFHSQTRSEKNLPKK